MDVLIVAGGKIDCDFAAAYLETVSFDRVIAVDKGLEAVERIGLCPDFVLGDFDSVNHGLLEKYRKEKDIEFIFLNPEKDVTDTHEAINFALEKGAKKIVILGGTGGRADHMIANVHLLMKPFMHHVEACLVDQYNKIYLVDKDMVLRKEQLFGTYVSLLPLTREVSGIFLKGFKYKLENAVLKIGDSLGVSNELAGDMASIEIGEGILIVVESKD